MVIDSLIRSRRRSISITVTREGRVVVRAPHHADSALIDAFVERKRVWVEKHCARMHERKAARPQYTPDEIAILKSKAAQLIPVRVEHFARLHGLTYRRIRISDARTRWGSCSPRKTLSFSWRLAMAPDEVVDYVVAHELAHTVELNHSDRFWRFLKTMIPEHGEHRNWLRHNGVILEYAEKQ
jgi:predicted metal-dependent hydrolase